MVTNVHRVACECGLNSILGALETDARQTVAATRFHEEAETGPEVEDRAGLSMGHARRHQFLVVAPVSTGVRAEIGLGMNGLIFTRGGLRTDVCAGSSQRRALRI
jgi:hypothetical protein